MPNSVRKLSRRAENYHNLPNMLHSQTLKLSTTRQRVRIAVAMCEATIAPDLPTERVNWSSGMRYGGGGVAKGGHDCRYRMHEIGVCRPKRESVHSVRVFVQGFVGNCLPTRQTVQLGGSHGCEVCRKNADSLIRAVHAAQIARCANCAARARPGGAGTPFSSS